MRRSQVLRTVRRILRNDQLITSGVALVLGLLVGGAVVGLRELIGLFHLLFYGAGETTLASVAAAQPWWLVLLAPVSGGLLVGAFYRFVMPGGRPQGVADVIEASALRRGQISLKMGVLAAFGNALSVGCGASLGREGPAVHLGAALSAWIGGQLRFGRNLARTLLGCGAAAAVAASFNAPIAGALFAHEVVVGHYAISAFAPVVIASVAATVISRERYGDFPAFDVPPMELVSLLEFPAFAGLGVIAGLTAIVFMRAAAFSSDVARRLPVPMMAKPAIAGFVLGVVAIWLPETLGVGYEATTLALAGDMSLAHIFVLAIAKIALTAVCAGFGFGGGVFSPSLAMGALVGGTYGILATAIAPDMSSGSEAYALIGMGAVAAAVLGAPISTTLIIFELTADYTLTLGVMVAVGIACSLTQQVFGHQSFFHWQLDRRGLALRGGHDLGLLRSIRVRDLKIEGGSIVPASLPLDDVRHELQRVQYGELFVKDPEGLLVGTITLADLSDAAFDHSLDDLVTAHDVARVDPPTLALDDSLETAIKLMLDRGEEHVAVIESRDRPRLVGCVHESDVLLAYNRALVRSRAEESGGGGGGPF